MEVWSCNPNDIPKWTEEDKLELHLMLAALFKWDKINMTEQERTQYAHKYSGAFFQHTDGGIYQFKHFARYSDRPDGYCVVYEHVWPFSQEPWVRPIEEWTPNRFTPISKVTVNDVMQQSAEYTRKQISERREARKAAK